MLENPSFKFSKEFYFPAPEKPREVVEVDTKQLMAAKKVEDESPYFHACDKGCEMEERIESGRPGYYKNKLKVTFCVTHQARCHHDGWQLGHWRGTESKKLSNCKPYVRKEN